MLSTNADKIRDYIHRQYELEEGTAAENVYALFAEDAKVRLADGSTVALEDVARSVTMLRQIPKSERTIEFSDIREEGDTATFHSFVRFRHPETGEWSESESDTVWRFNGQGKVVEGKSTTSIASLLPSRGN